MESNTPWSATVSNQRMNTLAGLHLRNIDIMVHMGGGQESPRKSEYKVNVKHVGREQTMISSGWHRKLILFPIPGQKHYTSGITSSRNILIFKSFWILHTVPFREQNPFREYFFLAGKLSHHWWPILHMQGILLKNFPSFVLRCY